MYKKKCFNKKRIKREKKKHTVRKKRKKKEKKQKTKHDITDIYNTAVYLIL